MVVVFAVFFTGCNKAQPTAAPTLPEGYSWHNNDEFGYKIAYPEGWTVVPGATEGLSGGMIHVQTFEEPDGPGMFSAIISTEYALAALKAQGGQDVVINGRNGYKVTSQITIGAGEHTIIRKMKTCAFVVNGKYYVIQGSYSGDLWDEYAATFDNAINSFVIE